MGWGEIRMKRKKGRTLPKKTVSGFLKPSKFRGSGTTKKKRWETFARPLILASCWP